MTKHPAETGATSFTSPKQAHQHTPAHQREPTLQEHEQYGEPMSSLLQVPDEPDHLNVLVGQNETIEFGTDLVVEEEQQPEAPLALTTEPKNKPTQPHRMDSNLWNRSRASSDWEYQTLAAVLSADSNMNLDGLLGAAPMSPPEQTSLSSAHSAVLTTISKPFGDAPFGMDDQHVTGFGYPTAFLSPVQQYQQQQRQQHYSTTSRPKGELLGETLLPDVSSPSRERLRGKPPKPAMSPSSLHKCTAPTTRRHRRPRHHHQFRPSPI